MQGILGTAVVVLCSLAAAACDEECSHGQIDAAEMSLTTKGSTFRDSLGRHVILRGVNAGGRSKLPPYLPFPFEESEFLESSVRGTEPFEQAVETYANKLVEWGHNVARVPFTWEAVEPTRGAYDAQFLTRYATLVQALSDRGVRVIVDFHQDAYTRAYCGDGFPLWAMENPDKAFRTDCTNWFSAYLGDDEVDADYDRFWNDEDGLNDSFEDMWREVVRTTRDIKGVIGYEIINEPHPGSLGTKDFYEQVLNPLYERIGDAMREEDPDALVFVDLTGVESQSGKTVFVMPDGDYFVFAPHYYSALVFIFGADNATWDLVTELKPFADYGDANDTPVLLGEFGTKTDADKADEYYADNFAGMDAWLMSGTAWEYSTDAVDWNDEGFRLTEAGDDAAGTETDSAEAVVRPYPAAVAGDILDFSYVRGERVMTLSWERDINIDSNVSVLRLPDRLLNGATPACTFDAGAGTCTHDIANQRLVVQVAEYAPDNSLYLTVRW